MSNNYDAVKNYTSSVKIVGLVFGWFPLKLGVERVLLSNKSVINRKNVIVK